MSLPNGVSRYYIYLPNDCTGWRGRKVYGRPLWLLWLQRAIWEEANGPLGKAERVNQTCHTIGCLTLEHLVKTGRPPRVPASQCRWCGGLLRRDRSDKTYCPVCNMMRMRATRRKDNDDERYG